jgi:hypothetical protein
VQGLVADGSVLRAEVDRKLDELKNDNKIYGENLLLLGPETHNLDAGSSAKKNPKRKTDYCHPMKRDFFVGQKVVHNLREYFTCEPNPNFEHDKSTRKSMSTEDQSTVTCLKKRSFDSVDVSVQSQETLTVDATEFIGCPQKRLIVGENGSWVSPVESETKSVIDLTENPFMGIAIEMPVLDYKLNQKFEIFGADRGTSTAGRNNACLVVPNTRVPDVQRSWAFKEDLGNFPQMVSGNIAWDQLGLPLGGWYGSPSSRRQLVKQRIIDELVLLNANRLQDFPRGQGPWFNQGYTGEAL